MSKPPLVDTKSMDLARHFLADVPGHTDDDRWALAAAIQRAAENAIEEIEEARGSLAPRRIENCISDQCRAPTACLGFGYCRDRHFLDASDPRYRAPPSGAH